MLGSLPVRRGFSLSSFISHMGPRGLVLGGEEFGYLFFQPKRRSSREPAPASLDYVRTPSKPSKDQTSESHYAIQGSRRLFTSKMIQELQPAQGGCHKEALYLKSTPKLIARRLRSSVIASSSSHPRLSAVPPCSLRLTHSLIIWNSLRAHDLSTVGDLRVDSTDTPLIHKHVL